MFGILSSLRSWFPFGKEPWTNGLGSNADTPDPISGLTPRQVAHLQYTWEQTIRKDFRHHGINLFLVFFDCHPEAQDLFKAFKGVPLNEVREHKRAVAHATFTMGALDNFIMNLQDSACVAAMFRKFGEDHVLRNVYKKDFEALPPTMMIFLEKALVPYWNDDLKQAWFKFLSFMAEASYAHLDETEDPKE